MKIYILPLTIVFLFLSACDDFVNEPKPTTSVASEKAFSSLENVKAVFTGIYRRLRWYGDDSGDDSEGIGAILNTWNVKGNDILRPDYHWFVFEYRYQDQSNPTGRKSNHVWKGMYELIGTCNTLITTVRAGNLSDAEKDLLEAEARAIRGWAYHHLVMNYAQPYLFDSNTPGVPIYTEAPTTTKIARDGNPRSPIGEVYDQIVGDLEFASEKLSEDRVAKWAINKNVANGFLARVYLHMGSYAKAAKTAEIARGGYNFAADEYNGGFQDLGDNEWMWGAPQSNNQTLYYGSFGSFWDGSRYPPFYFNPNFVATFSKTDVRNTFKSGAGSKSDLYLTSKFVPKSDFGEDVVLMRMSEMYLIQIESLARDNQEGTAATLLYELQKNRDTEAVASGNTGKDLIDEIMLERRKELYGERGPDFIDARRLGLGLIRDNSHGSFNFVLDPGDPRYIHQIPQDEIDNNDAISDSDQNPE